MAPVPGPSVRLDLYCVDCVHCRRGSDCGRPTPADAAIDLVTGKPISRVSTDCWYERSWQYRPHSSIRYIPDHVCGPHGRYFKRKEIPDGIDEQCG